MQRAFVVALALSVSVAVACSSGSNPPPVDSAGSGSGSGSGSAKAGFGSGCVTVSDTSTECTSGVCTNTFNMFPAPVCSQKCTVLGGSDATCPVGSMGQKCNQQGYCRP
ncbi:MAG: hypothetical protein ABI591_12365 [Kofleriaceae bacterium]